MVSDMRRGAVRFVLAFCLLAVSGVVSAGAQSWPTRPITMVVPFPPGPALDLVARLVGAKVADVLGQPIVVENRTGANGTIGSNMSRARRQTAIRCSPRPPAPTSQRCIC
jgi:tripartite-type tricarboxylate transporter receptor subunit TctC